MSFLVVMLAQMGRSGEVGIVGMGAPKGWQRDEGSHSCQQNFRVSDLQVRSAVFFLLLHHFKMKSYYTLVRVKVTKLDWHCH